MKRQITELEAQLAKLLVRLDNGWFPADFSLPAFATIQLNQQQWPGNILGIAIEGEELHIRLRGQLTGVLEDGTSSYIITATTEDGSILWAQSNNTTVHFGEVESESISILRCNMWSYTPSVAPLAWVGAVHGIVKIDTPGNVMTYRKNGKSFNSSVTSVRLATNELATYFINQKKQSDAWRVTVVFENLTDETFSVQRISQELPLLRVVLSAPMKPGVLYGVNVEGQTTAAIAVSHEQAARPVSSSRLSPVPTTFGDVQSRITWCAPFYERLHGFYIQNEGVNPISFSLARYGHSLSALDIDTQFELVAGAIWMLVNELSRQQRQTDETFIKNPIGYGQDWLRERFGEKGAIISEELRQSVDLLMQGPLDEYSEASKIGPALQQRYNRVQRLRRAYAVLLCQAIGYDGAINTFSTFNNDGGKEGWLNSPKLGEQEQAEARRVFRAESDITGLSVWPTFELPTLPTDELTRSFAVFAEEVRYQTHGKVSARLRRLPNRKGEPIYLSFRLMVDKAPETQVVLFTIEQLKIGFEVQGWTDKAIKITSEDKLVDFQNKLLESEDFRLEIERLLLIEEDIRRGEA